MAVIDDAKPGEAGGEAGVPNITRQGVEQRIKELLDAGVKDSAYEALQLFGSQANRRAKDGEPQQGIGVALEGATALIDQGYPECGLELGTVILKIAQEASAAGAGAGGAEGEAAVAGQTVPHDLVRHAVLHIDAALAAHGGKVGADDGVRKKLLKLALKYSQAKGPRAHGDKELNATYGDVLWRTGELDKAVSRLVLAEAPGPLAEKLLESFPPAADGQGGEGGNRREDRERLLAMGVLTFLSLENLRDANALMDAYQQGLAQSSDQQRSPLLTFLALLLQTCERDAADLFQGLLKVYKPWLDAEPAFNPLLQAVGERFFGLRPPPNMMSMLASMLGGGGMGGGGMGGLFG